MHERIAICYRWGCERKRFEERENVTWELEGECSLLLWSNEPLCIALDTLSSRFVGLSRVNHT